MVSTFVRFTVRFVLATCLHGLLSHRLTVVAFAIQTSPPSDSSGTACNVIDGEASVIDVSEARERIGSGRVYVHHNFLSDEQLRWLSDDMSELESEGKFVTNGLSDTRKGLKGEHAASSTASSKADQGFSVKYDRSVCPIPWWRETLTISEVSEPTPDKGDLASIQSKLDSLRRGLSETMGRPTMLKNDLEHVRVAQFCNITAVLHRLTKWTGVLLLSIRAWELSCKAHGRKTRGDERTAGLAAPVSEKSQLVDIPQ